MLMFGTTLWGGCATSFESFTASRFLSGFAIGAGEGLPPAIISQLFFLHERGTWTGAYMMGLCCGASGGPLLSGFLMSALGYRWHFYLTGILAGVSFLTILFLFPETSFNRDQGDTQISTKRSYIQELKPWSKTHKDSNIINLLLRAYPTLLFPAVLYSFVGFAGPLAWALGVLTTCANVYQNPPYNMSPGIQSLINVPGLLGIIFGAFWGGAVTDLYSKWRAKRNGGVFEPEFRLPVLILPAVLVPVGCIMYAPNCTATD